MSRRFCFGVVLLMIMATGSGAAETGRRSFQTSDSVKLSFLEAGKNSTGKQNLTVALIPGWNMPATIWRNQIQAFSRRYHSLAFDPRGQGESEVPATGYTAERRATDIKEFLEPLSNVLLIGWSLGAIESLQYVHMFGGERLAGLVLVDSSVGEEPAPKGGGNFKQNLREDRDGALVDFMRAIFATPRGDHEITELARGAKQMALEDSLALLDYPFERGHWRNIARSFKKPLLYVVTPQFEAQAANLKKKPAGDTGGSLQEGRPRAVRRRAGAVQCVDRRLCQESFALVAARSISPDQISRTWIYWISPVRYFRML